MIHSVCEPRSPKDSAQPKSLNVKKQPKQMDATTTMMVAMETATATTETPAPTTAVANVDGAAAVATPSVAPVEVPKTPIERLNDVVDKSPLDFNSWVQLLALVEAEVRAYDQCLVALCCRIPKGHDVTLWLRVLHTTGVNRTRDSSVNVRSVPRRVPTLLWLLEQGTN